MDWIGLARQWWDQGLTVLPLAADGTKRPAMPWGDYKIDRPQWQTIEWMFTRYRTDGAGVVCGSASGQLEMIELEARAMGLIGEWESIFVRFGRADLWQAIRYGYAEATPSGGLHLYYRVDGPARGNLKLAMDSEHQVLIETRGQGGFSVIAPSGGRSHPSGLEWTVIDGSVETIATISTQDRDLVHEFARVLDQTPEPVPTAGVVANGVDHGDRPGDRFNAEASWESILVGWKPLKIAEGYLGWQRPGKRHPGISATTGRNGSDRLFVFSTSTPFEPERPYDKFGAFALLEHGGDLGEAARALRRRGYGAQESISLPPLEIGSAPASEAVAEAKAAEEPREVPEAVEIDKFWTRRPVLTNIRSWAELRLVSPWALLGSIMLRCLVIVPPWVTLPPVIGGAGSLNSFLAVVGPSGAGKNASESLADEILRTDESIYAANLGSGEGIVHQYAHRDRKTGEQEIDRVAVLFRCPEVDTLAALDARRGSILSSVLRDAFSGDQLGQAYVESIKRLTLAPHSYRLCLNLGVQPRRAGPLLAEEAGGTPQRFWWMEAVDRTVGLLPSIIEPSPITLSRHAWPQGRTHLSIPDEVREELIETRLRQVRGEIGALDGQRMFTREKAAYAFTILDDRQVMTIEDWQLAGEFLAESDRVRQGVVATLEEMDGEVVGKRVAARVLTERTVDEDRAARLHRKMCERVEARLAEHAGEPIFVSVIQKTIPGRDRDRFEDALDDLAAQGRIVIEHRGRRRLIKGLGSE